MGQRKNFLKKDREYFVKCMENFFSTIGTETDSYIPRFKCYNIETAFGILQVRCIDPSDNVLSVMARFIGDKDSFAEVNEWGLDCNPFTGKWNHHLMDGSVDEIIDHIKYRYSCVLAYTRNSQNEIEFSGVENYG